METNRTNRIVNVVLRRTESGGVRMVVARLVNAEGERVLGYELAVCRTDAFEGRTGRSVQQLVLSTGEGTSAGLTSIRTLEGQMSTQVPTTALDAASV